MGNFHTISILLKLISFFLPILWKRTQIINIDHVFSGSKQSVARTNAVPSCSTGHSCKFVQRNKTTTFPATVVHKMLPIKPFSFLDFDLIDFSMCDWGTCDLGRGFWPRGADQSRLCNHQWGKKKQNASYKQTRQVSSGKKLLIISQSQEQMEGPIWKCWRQLNTNWHHMQNVHF